MQIIGFGFHPQINRVLFILTLYYSGKTVIFQKVKILRLAMPLPLHGHTDSLKPEALSKSFEMQNVKA